MKSLSPSGYFIFLEIIVNFALITEVSIRLLALGKLFWKSTWNIIDMVVVVFCLITLVFLLALGHCSETRSREAFADSVILIVRNGIQLTRLIAMLRRNQRRITKAPANIDFESVSTPLMANDLISSEDSAIEFAAAFYEEDDEYF
ncbi:hypothetical protein HK096_005424 [Nowakowskiella sp. JEL0078]|nr:hypothetical protein HK096_005424 [Nowakowskiella sp. JEL0078]